MVGTRWRYHGGSSAGCCNTRARGSEGAIGSGSGPHPFVGALGVGFGAIPGVDFLYEHDISVNMAQHCLVLEAHDGLIVPLVGQQSAPES